MVDKCLFTSVYGDVDAECERSRAGWVQGEEDANNGKGEAKSTGGKSGSHFDALTRKNLTKIVFEKLQDFSVCG